MASNRARSNQPKIPNERVGRRYGQRHGQQSPASGCVISARCIRTPRLSPGAMWTVCTEPEPLPIVDGSIDLHQPATSAEFPVSSPMKAVCVKGCPQQCAHLALPHQDCIARWWKIEKGWLYEWNRSLDCKDSTTSCRQPRRVNIILRLELFFVVFIAKRKNAFASGLGFLRDFLRLQMCLRGLGWSFIFDIHCMHGRQIPRMDDET